MAANRNRKTAGPRVPGGTVVYAVGDIHGRADLLDQLLARIAADAAATQASDRRLVFVGDYVDRGPDSARVVETLISGLPRGFGAVCLRGNHDQMLLDFLERPDVLDLWYFNGAAATLASYGVDTGGPAVLPSDQERIRDRLAGALPRSHRRFFEELPLSAAIGDYFFAHAGVRPGVALEEQTAEDLMWIRERFLASDADFGKVVVHGHTPLKEPVVRPNRIGIDTGAWMSSRLTALRLVGREQSFLMTGG